MANRKGNLSSPGNSCRTSLCWSSADTSGWTNFCIFNLGSKFETMDEVTSWFGSKMQAHSSVYHGSLISLEVVSLINWNSWFWKSNLFSSAAGPGSSTTDCTNGFKPSSTPGPVSVMLSNRDLNAMSSELPGSPKEEQDQVGIKKNRQTGAQPLHGTTTPKLDRCPPIEWWFPTSLPWDDLATRKIYQMMVQFEIPLTDTTDIP